VTAGTAKRFTTLLSSTVPTVLVAPRFGRGQFSRN
jgi:hypothetical protein